MVASVKRPAEEMVPRIVALVRAAALAGQPCPDNITLAHGLGLSSVSGPPRLLDRAQQAGLIVVRRGQNVRVVEAADGSWRTAGTVRVEHVPVGRNRPKARGERRPQPVRAAPVPQKIAEKPQAGGTPSPLPCLAPNRPPAVSGHSFRTCQWPTGDKRGDIRFLCEAAPMQGSAYCPQCHARAYQPLPPKRVAA